MMLGDGDAGCGKLREQLDEHVVDGDTVGERLVRQHDTVIEHVVCNLVHVLRQGVAAARAAPP